jgi:hypothetical protein
MESAGKKACLEAKRGDGRAIWHEASGPDDRETARCHRRHCERKRSNPERLSLDCVVAFAPLRKRFAFVAGNDGNQTNS